ncbi:MAG: adenylate/guanylate cyclase domain-containing protein, partial [Nannocystaceae bacterium]
ALLACAVYALLLRPLYPLIIGGISAISHVVYYFVAAHFGELIVTKSWLLARTTEAVQLEGYFFNHLLIVPAGALLMARLTRNGRELILRSGASEYRNAQLARYFSPALANRLGEGIPVERGGEVREIAVLFQDLQGFTKISEQLGASATVALLAEIHDEMVETIFAEEGILDKYLGDGLMACFGSIGDSRDIAGRAVRSALAMRTALAQINQIRSARGESILHQRIGIHVGPAVVGNIGSSARLEFTAIGDTVNTAARVEAYAKQVNTDILLTGATVEQLEDRAVVQSLGAVQLRGKDRSTEIYALETWREVDRASEASDE